MAVESASEWGRPGRRWLQGQCGRASRLLIDRTRLGRYHRTVRPSHRVSSLHRTCPRRLEQLVLAGNPLGGTIPAEFGNLESLFHLDLSHSGLGELEPARLDLRGNDISGCLAIGLAEVEQLLLDSELPACAPKRKPLYDAYRPTRAFGVSTRRRLPRSIGDEHVRDRGANRPRRREPCERAGVSRAGACSRGRTRGVPAAPSAGTRGFCRLETSQVFSRRGSPPRLRCW